jgi:hypothetical protein
MKLIIGCPIYKRDWIFPAWAAAIERQSVNISDIGFVFITSSNDEKTIKCIDVWKNIHPEIPLIETISKDDVAHHEHAENSRQWTMSKYHNMISLRNTLLNRVREIQPEYFFSLDSDILLQNPMTIELLVSHIKDGADAVSPLMFMTPFDIQFPSVMNWVDKPGDKARRLSQYPLGTYFKADIIMAAKMMSKDVYNNVDYIFHSQGEDLGWCANANKKGFNNLYSASYIYAPHIMHPQMLKEYFKNGDKRYFSVVENLTKI